MKYTYRSIELSESASSAAQWHQSSENNKLPINVCGMNVDMAMQCLLRVCQNCGNNNQRFGFDLVKWEDAGVSAQPKYTPHNCRLAAHVDDTDWNHTLENIHKVIYFL